ncbi:hypothetical protein DY000_02005738 [Brassica cretica]|uniref:Uncharacterized protein n=1 Tax=Brassica cretica TaxID=69181 RepID=A0ABQ7C005_BRACR|nr:hypothetical protein DY000_02005738 [Brassica cretica]
MSTLMSSPPFLTFLAPHNLRRWTSAVFEHRPAFRCSSIPEDLFIDQGCICYIHRLRA